MDTVSSQQHLHELLKEFDTAMFVTRADDGHMHARPMAIADFAEDGTIYLVTGIHSPKVAEVEDNAIVTLTFQSPKRYASLCGRVAVTQDKALIERMWKEAWKVWFPQGKTDPAISLLRFDAQDGEYWDNSGAQGLKYAFSAAKAYVQGKTPTTDATQHSKVSL